MKFKWYINYLSYKYHYHKLTFLRNNSCCSLIPICWNLLLLSLFLGILFWCSASELEAEINELHRRINRAGILIGGLPAGLTHLIPPVLYLGAFFNVPITTHDRNHLSYISKKTQILVKFNNVHTRDTIMKEYLKKQQVLK